MRIALRTGGGRGVYELAGNQGAYKATDVFDKELFYELAPDLIIPGRASAAIRQGKPRIKLNDQKITTHLYRLLAGLLLLPKPKREFKATSGDILVAFEAYSMTVIKIDLASMQQSRAVIRPTDILLANSDGLEQHLKFVDRMSRIMALWRAADEADSELAGLLRVHKSCLYEPEVNFKAVEKAAKNVLGFFDTLYDPLDKLENFMGLSTNALDENEESIIDLNTFGLEDTKSLQLAKVENLKRWRHVAVRGNAASKFRTEVRASYNDTCLFTGQRLPKMSITASAGVDAAHILPWSIYDINSVTNGICINKQCHWAFDSGILRFSFDSSINEYVIDIPELVKNEASQCGFVLSEYEAIVGLIPRSRLPNSQELWPNREYLQAYNELMYG